MLSVFITPWTNPMFIQRAINDACASDTASKNATYGFGGIGDVRMVAGDRVVGEALQEIRILVAGRVLERADAQVAGGDPHEDRPRQGRFTSDRIAGRDDGERSGRGDAERVHRFADHVLAQHRADGGLAVSAASERRTTRSLEVHVTALPGAVDEFAEQQRPAVSEPRREAAELVTGVRHRHRGRSR